MQNFPFDYDMRLGDAGLSPKSLDSGTAKFDLMILMHEEGDALKGVLEYNTDLFNEDSMQRLLQHFSCLLDNVSQDLKQSLAEIDLMTADELQKIQSEWSGITTEYPRDKSVHAVFEDVVKENPDTVALEFEGQSITYAELNKRADEIKTYLLNKDIGVNDRVGLYTDRSPEAIASILGILKTAASYVPLDPSYPAERIAYIIKDTDIELILKGDSVSAEDLSLAENCEVIDISGISIDADDAAASTSNASANSAAYIMYTSGSTGQPKGSVIPHRAIVRLVKETDFVTLDANQRILQYAPISFDASTIEIWGALLNGGTLVIMKPGAATLEELGQTLIDQKVTTLWLTSSLFSQMVDFQPDALTNLKQLLAGGDV